MTTDEQQRANHLALVAAPLLAQKCSYAIPNEDVLNALLDIAEALQRAAEERVKCSH